MPRRIALVLLVLMLVFASSAQATTVRFVDFQALVGSSDFIFMGTVESVQAKNLGDKDLPRLVTDVRFSIQRVFKGRNTKSFTIRLIGGSSDGYTLRIPGQPTFKPQEEVVLFLEKTAADNFAICGMEQGKFTVTRDDKGKAQVVRDVSSEVVVIPETPSESDKDAQLVRFMSLEKLLSIIRKHR